MDISETADRAADYIERHGWSNNAFIAPDGRVCLIGALAQGQAGRLDDFTSYKRGEALYSNPTSSAISEYIGNVQLSRWNDTQGRTAEEVIGVLRDVATKYRSDEMRSNASHVQSVSGS